MFLLGYAGSLLVGGLFPRFGEGRLLSTCDGQASHCRGFSCCAAQALGHLDLSGCKRWASAAAAVGPQSTDSVVVDHRLSSSMACRMFLDQGSNPCLLHWQVDS